ncbi:MAG: hypothetical protein IKY83_00600 [Proteobacteria bacterium]|nr:hypothetical protein [Pseudomonadota bacterium]
MKKICLSLACIGLSSFLFACGDDGSVKCGPDFAAGCQDGVYMKCVDGLVQKSDSVKLDSVYYVCNGDKLEADVECRDGKFYNKPDDSDAGSIVCGETDVIFICESNRISRAPGSMCNDNKVVSCDDGHLKQIGCSNGYVCEEYERGDEINHGCFKESDVTDGCLEGVTVQGACGGDILTFCSRKDASKGKTLRLDCATYLKDRQESCMKINDDFGYDCTKVCPDEGYTIHGACENNKLVYCGKLDANSDWQTVEWDCAADGLTCGFDHNQYNCK